MWIEAHLGLSRHPKVGKLAELLGETRHEVVGRLLMLWWFAAEFAPSGCLKGFTNAHIAEACEWKGNPDFFIGALVECRWVDESGRRYKVFLIHDWDQYSGKWLRWASHRNERKRKLRAAKNGVTEQDRHSSSPVRGTGKTLSTVPNHTLQDINPPTPLRDVPVPRPESRPGQINAGRSVPDVAATRERIRRLRESLR